MEAPPAGLRPLPPPSDTRRAAGWLAVALGLPSLLVYACLFYVEQGILVGPEVPGSAAACTIRVFISTFLCLVPFALLPLPARTYLALATPVLLVLYASNVVHVLEYEELITIGAFDALRHTNRGESAEFLAERLPSVLFAVVSAAGILGACAWIAVRRIPRGYRPDRATRLVIAGLGVAACLFGLAKGYRLFPVSTLKNGVEYVQWRQEFRAYAAAHRRTAPPAVRTASNEAEEVYVLVIGESVRRSHLPQYGYPRDTMPRLRRLANTVAFTDVVSTSTQTQTAVKALLTGAGAEAIREPAGRSVLTVASDLGFKTYWLSNQDRTDSSEMTLLSDEAGQVTYVNHSWSAGGRYDDRLLPLLDRALQEPGRKKLIVLHLMGSHGLYNQRYPAAFEHFRPAALAAEVAGFTTRLTTAERETVTYYDNSIRYTDYVLSEVVQRLGAREREAVLVFVSDHGENLYDTPHKRLGHGLSNPTRFEVEIPLVVWYSDAFAAGRPEKVAGIRRNVDRPICSNRLFDAMADLLDASFDGADVRRSFFHPDFAPEERRIVSVEDEVIPYRRLLAAPAGPSLAAGR